jgi:DNA polymerase-3 subunit delta'
MQICQQTAHTPMLKSIRTEGLSISKEEVRELLTRSLGTIHGDGGVVVMEDADRLNRICSKRTTEKQLKNPATELCGFYVHQLLHDVLPTIRSRCRHLQLVTPSTQAVARVSYKHRDGISPNMADFAARVSQGHIGRARYLSQKRMMFETPATQS